MRAWCLQLRVWGSANLSTGAGKQTYSQTRTLACSSFNTLKTSRYQSFRIHTTTSLPAKTLVSSKTRGVPKMSSPEHSSKRVKLSSSSSLNRDISPPPLRRQKGTTTGNLIAAGSSVSPNAAPSHCVGDLDSPSKSNKPRKPKDVSGDTTLIISSPFKLTQIRNLPASKNVDTITISDILGSPLIREIWSFNFMHDLEWMVSHLDEDVAKDIDIKIIHGNWRKDDTSRKALESERDKLIDLASSDGGYKIELITAYMPDMFGTHHTKMLVLFYHDDSAEIVVHTANMIPWDWSNMTQAVWRSPKLPLLADDSLEKKEGVGYVFKEAFMAYVGAYGWRTKSLMEQVMKYNFRAVRAVFVGHVPGDHAINGPENKLFGWSKVKRVLTRIGRGGGHGVNKAGRVVYTVKGGGEIAMQASRSNLDATCSSVATLGESYFDSVLYPTFSTCRPGGVQLNAFDVLRTPSSSASSSRPSNRPELALVFPTVENVRTSVLGWDGGGSIFMKSQKPVDKAQLNYIKPMLRVWGQPPIRLSTAIAVEAERGKATPHIKTYNFFSPPRIDSKDSDTTDSKDESGALTIVSMDWAMITSANLSKQAWGNPTKGSGPSSTSKIQSYEAGILIHPGLWKDLLKDEAGAVTMSAVGSKDWLVSEGQKIENCDIPEDMDGEWDMVKVGVRLAYDYPLRPYDEDDEPWCKDMPYEGRDWKGITWPPRWEDRLRAAMGLFPSDDDDGDE
ncbi:hypothetical protein TWF106_011025 [Orbilia oligospora]|uniref:Tyrosyl-DNA phosphodiesterase 1 n=1 Tax=Orbilia oligospora TaxID=2813651 RepID=A0A7C8QF07_ORBOL|nr:hypothetical protein TWF106_011025 [Orbilia oligospora]